MMPSSIKRRFRSIFPISFTVVIHISIIMFCHVFFKQASSFHLMRISSSSLSISARFNRYSRNTITTSTTYLSSSSTSSSQTNNDKITEQDIQYMNLAVEAAQKGVGNTYPNPAVGCVIVNNKKSNGDVNDDAIIGVGFHPKAGYPHAEIFALFEACGYVPSGVEAAQTVVQNTSNKRKNTGTNHNDDESNKTSMMEKIDELLKTYSSVDFDTKDGGAKKLFQNSFDDDDNVTAYVTLEPCCHYGQTPPCAKTFVLAGVNRVVVGYRDPNPRVDGGGVTMLQNDGIEVDLISLSPMKEEEGNNDSNSSHKSAFDCANIVKAFAKRITPRTDENGGADVINYEASMNGAKRSVLRSLAGKWKQEGSMTEFHWPSYYGSIDVQNSDTTLEDAVESLSLDHGWLETIDGALWDKELILLRLTNAVAKKKGAKLLGTRVANELKAHVAQTVGHTVLLYRPGLPPVLDLDELVSERSK